MAAGAVADAAAPLMQDFEAQLATVESGQKALSGKLQAVLTGACMAHEEKLPGW